MHLELVVPALLAAPVATSGAAPALELLLARGRRSESEGAASLEDWLRRSFELPEDPLPAGALGALAAGASGTEGAEPGSAFWTRADPVHLRADRDRVVLIPSEAFTLEPAEAGPLAAALNRHFAAELELTVLGPRAWAMRIAPRDALGAAPPIDLAGRNVDPILPGKRWHALLNEIQMVLYAHPVNAEREKRGDPVINSLWLWGAGALPGAASGPWVSVSADDPAALGLARLAGMRRRTTAGGAADWLEGAPEDGRHLVVLDALRGAAALGDHATAAARLQALERDWFAPVLAALRDGRVGMVSVHAPEAAAAFETIRGDLRRFWRRARPLGAYGQKRRAPPEPQVPVR